MTPRFAYDITFRHDGKDKHWLQFHVDRASAEAYAVKCLEREFPDGATELVSVLPAINPEIARFGIPATRWGQGK